MKHQRILLLVVLFACGGGSSNPDGGVFDAGRDVSTDAIDAATDTADAAMDATDSGMDAAMGCPTVVRCDGPPPDPGAEEDWRHSILTGITTAVGNPHHRGRDFFIHEGDEAWAMAKFAYGLSDDDLKDEDVEVWLQIGCAGDWTLVDRVATTRDGDHPTVLGVEDTGGWVFLQIDTPLPVGRHRLHFVVKGDLSTANQRIQVLPADAQIVLTDVDGTLTENENAALAELLLGPSPAVQIGAPEALGALADRGYFILYLSARPHWLQPRTHEWVAERGLPPGLVRTTLGLTGETGASAISFKVGELADLTDRLGIVPTYAIGNKESDAEAFQTGGVAAEHRLLYRLDGDLFGGVRFDDYTELATEFELLPDVCL